MATFTIKIEQIDNGFVVVDAESRQEAKDKARELWYEGVTNWTDGDIKLSVAEEETVG